jgi:hypothetical protein
MVKMIPVPQKGIRPDDWLSGRRQIEVLDNCVGWHYCPKCETVVGFVEEVAGRIRYVDLGGTVFNYRECLACGLFWTNEEGGILALDGITISRPPSRYRYKRKPPDVPVPFWVRMFRRFRR